MYFNNTFLSQINIPLLTKQHSLYPTLHTVGFHSNTYMLQTVNNLQLFTIL